MPSLRALVRLLLRRHSTVTVNNQERVPTEGPLLVLANHPSDLDPVITQYACPRLVHYMAKKELWQYPFVRFMLNLWRAFGITPRKPDKTSLKTAVQLLKEGRVVCVYPEGGVTREPPLSPLLPGITLIVRQSRATVICLGINGTDTVMPLGETKMRPGDPIIATWGEPKPDLYQMPPEEMLRWLREELLRLSGRG